MKIKKIIVTVGFAVISVCISCTVYGADMNMYVNNIFVVRDIQTVAGFDMIPVLDISGELGLSCEYDNNILNMKYNGKTYTFTEGQAAVYDESGNIYGLDVVMQHIGGKLQIPAKFFTDVLGMNYGWDWVTNTLFLKSDEVYSWFVSTADYQNGIKIKNTQNKLAGWWFYYETEELMQHFSENIYFGADGSFFSQTWREKCYGTYKVVSENRIEVVYDWYYCSAGSSEYVYEGRGNAVYTFNGNYVIGENGRVYEHRNSFVDVGLQY